MHVSIGRYRGPCTAAEDLVVAARYLTAAIRHAPGFVSYALLDMGQGELTSISVFESRLELDAGDRIIAAWIAEHLPTLQRTPAPFDIGEIILQRGM